MEADARAYFLGNGNQLKTLFLEATARLKKKGGQGMWGRQDAIFLPESFEGLRRAIRDKKKLGDEHVAAIILVNLVHKTFSPRNLEVFFSECDQPFDVDSNNNTYSGSFAWYERKRETIESYHVILEPLDCFEPRGMSHPDPFQGLGVRVPKLSDDLLDEIQRSFEFGNAVEQELRFRKIESDLAELKDFNKSLVEQLTEINQKLLVLTSQRAQ